MAGSLGGGARLLFATLAAAQEIANWQATRQKRRKQQQQQMAAPRTTNHSEPCRRSVPFHLGKIDYRIETTHPNIDG